MEALRERGILRQNAPHLVHDLAFVVPRYDWWEAPFYGLGLKVYDLLAGKYGFGSSQLLSREQTLQRIPTLKQEGLRGGIIYYDGQFDDARLLINLIQTAAEHGATPINYVEVTAVSRDADGVVNGITATDIESGREFHVSANVVINATGPFADAIRKMADPNVKPMIVPSQGIHLVFDRSFLPGDSAIMVPHTPDGRVIFAIPWHGHTLVGTTDTPLAEVPTEPLPLAEETDFLLETAGRYLHKVPTRSDVLSVFVGIRPLVGNSDANTAALSRDHTIRIDNSGLLTIAGGKWTTYRRMAEDCVNQAAMLGRLPEKAAATETLKIHGFHEASEQRGDLAVYGSDAHAIHKILHNSSAMAEKLHPALPYRVAEVVWAVREEMARTVEDVLARRTRALFLNSKAAFAMAPRAAQIMAAELNYDKAWQEDQVKIFQKLATAYSVP
jgi:glycerol-3-phosphate dehydrogenase